MKKIINLFLLIMIALALLIGCNFNSDKKSAISGFNALSASTEFDIVILNGRVMDPETNFDAGQPIRFEVQEKGKFAPLTLEEWTKQFYAAPLDFGGGIPGELKVRQEDKKEEVQISH